MAALLVIAIYVNNELKPQPHPTETYDGLYDWQYARDAWQGHVKVEKDGAASVDLVRYMTCAGVKKPLKLLRQSGAGKAQVDGDGNMMHVNIPVQFIDYDARCSVTGFAETTVLVGDLPRTPAFAGSVEYRSQNGAPLGGMILVKGITP